MDVWALALSVKGTKVPLKSLLLVGLLCLVWFGLVWLFSVHFVHRNIRTDVRINLFPCGGRAKRAHNNNTIIHHILLSF